MKKLLKRALAILLAAGMVLGMNGFLQPVAASAEDDSVTFDFRDGSIIPTDTDGKSDIVYGDMTIKVGTKNAYQYNGAQHGVAFKDGNSIEIQVSGPTKVLVGDCAYSANAELTIQTADGSWSQTSVAKTGCYHNDGSTVDFKYNGKATTLVIDFTATTYVPCIILASAVEVPDENGVPADSVYMYNFADGSVVPTTNDSANKVNGAVSSADGFLTVTSAGSTYFHDKDHGLAVANGDSISVKVAGDAVITLSTCEYGGSAANYWLAKSDKGELTETTQPAVRKDYDGQSSVFHYSGVATTLTFTLVGEGESYIHGVNVANLPAETKTPELVGNGKIDIWDFGAAELDSEQYNNLLTVDIINNWYPDTVEAASAGANILSFATEDIMFNASGKTNNRFRTTNEAITRYDAKSKSFTEEDGTVTELTGYVYSNNSSTSRVYVGVKLYEGDIFTVYTGSNGGEATIYFETPSGEIEKAVSVSDGAKNTFYAAEYGIYKLYTLDEKLVVYRMLREHTAPALTSGTITVPDSLTDYQLLFTNDKTGAVTEVTPEADDSYETWLRDGYTYSLSLKNANGYVIKSECSITAAAGGGEDAKEEIYNVVKGDMLRLIAAKYSSTVKAFAKLNNLADPDLILIGQKLLIPGTKTETSAKIDVLVESVDLVTLTGKLTGLTETALSAIQLSFSNPGYAYIPEFTISGDVITAALERGVEYAIVAEGINDFDLAAATTIKLTEDTAKNIEFESKPVYTVSFTTTGIGAADWKNAAVTFTNINESGYSYSFTPANETVKLRDGQYSVKVSGVGNSVAQKLTADAKVNGKAASVTIPFETLTTWDFSVLNKAYGGSGIETIDETLYCSGLKLAGNVKENKTYLLLNAGGEIKIPVKAGDLVTANYCYCAGFVFDGDAATAVDEKSGSTSTIDSAVYTAPADGYTVITALEGGANSQTYFTSIVVTTPAEYKETVTVGTDKDFKTINEALDYITDMTRTEDQRVTVMIDPGNYEEMLVINLANISLVNAAGENASIDVTDKGVNIADNAVRITSYYGHGYSYYSMGADCKYDAELLAVNKSNGSYSFKNPGSGTTSGSYWNSTVVIYASGFEADGIIFENSYNQYISEKEANDIVVMEVGNKGERPTTVGDTSVQTKSFVERAGALAIAKGCEEIYFNNCKFIGRQDTVYGAETVTAAFNKCDILGACDYIYGGMTAVFNECNLVMNTSETSTDMAYITAAQQSTARGFLFYDCTVTSTTPGVDTASEYGSKPGYFGRPWAANTSEAVFFNTTIEASCDYYGEESLIKPEGWLATLGGESVKMYEYGTVEGSGEDNQAARVTWSTVLTEPTLSDGTDLSTKEKAIEAFLGEWKPF